MILASQMYSKLFRPWDIAKENEKCDILRSQSRSANTESNLFSTTDFKKTSSEKKVKECNKDFGKHCSSEVKLKKSSERENKLRKIRNQVKGNSNSLHQDSTISTTTHDNALIGTTIVHEDYLQNFDKKEIQDRLGQTPEFISTGCKSGKSVSSESDTKLKIKSQADYNKIRKSFPTGDKHSDNLTASRCKEEIGVLNSSPLPPHHLFSQCYPEQLINPLDVQLYPDPYSQQLPRYPSDFAVQADLAQSLGIPPNDPLLLESFAQGYAMELEYARILHQENQAKLLNARKQRPKKYRCPHCDVGFSNNGQLKGHIRIHTGERPFKCDDKNCGKTFTRNEELTRHRRIHSGLRPYACQTCGKKFGRRDHLKKHTKTHLVQAERMMPMFVPLSSMVPQNYPYLYGY